MLSLTLKAQSGNVGLALRKQIRSKNYTGEPNLLLMYDIVKRAMSEGLSLNMATPLIEGMSHTLRTWPPTAGGGMTGDMQWNPTFQWFDDQITQQSAMALVLSGGVRLDTVIMHGCKPSSGGRALLFLVLFLWGILGSMFSSVRPIGPHPGGHMPLSGRHPPLSGAL